MPRVVRFDSSPALGADGTIYVGSEDDNLYAITQATQPVLTLANSVNFTNAAPGSVVTYTLLYTNTGSTATNVTLTDTLPAGVSYVSGSAGSEATFDAATDTLRWSLGTLAFGSGTAHLPGADRVQRERGQYHQQSGGDRLHGGEQLRS